MADSGFFPAGKAREERRVSSDGQRVVVRCSDHDEISATKATHSHTRLTLPLCVVCPSPPPSSRFLSVSYLKSPARTPPTPLQGAFRNRRDPCLDRAAGTLRCVALRQPGFLSSHFRSLGREEATLGLREKHDYSDALP